jgi:tetratricopeptide (TPR) repeat protein
LLRVLRVLSGALRDICTRTDWARPVSGWLGLNSDPAPNSRLAQLQEMTTPAMEIKVEANALFKAGNYQEAAECYSRAMASCVDEVMSGSIVTTDEQKASIFANRAACWLKLGDHAQTISDCDAALELKPLYVSAMLRRATALEATGETARACEDLRHALTIEPANSRATKALNRLQGVTDVPAAASVAAGDSSAVDEGVIAASLARGTGGTDSKFDEARLVKPGEWEEWDEMMKADAGGGDEALLEEMVEKQMSEMRASLGSGVKTA